MIRLLKTLPLKALPLNAVSLAAVAALGLAASAWAEGADHRLEKAFGSTIVSTYPDGRQAELWLKRDGTYTAEGRRKVDRSSGSWQVKQVKGGDQLCMKQHAPIPAPFDYCTPVPEGGIDKPWSGKAYTGEQISIKLVKGVFDPGKGATTEAGADKARASKADAEQN